MKANKMNFKGNKKILALLFGEHIFTRFTHSHVISVYS